MQPPCIVHLGPRRVQGNGHFKFGPTGRGFHEWFGPYAGGADHWEHNNWIGGGPHRDAQRRSQHVGKDSNGNGAIFFRGRPGINMVDHHHDRWTAAGKHIHEHVFAGDNMTHSTDAFGREAVRMILEHPVAAEGEEQQPLFVYIPFTAPHWPVLSHHRESTVLLLIIIGVLSSSLTLALGPRAL